MSVSSKREAPFMAHDPGLFDAEQLDYREAVRTFVTREAVPSREDWARQRAIPRAVLRTAGEYGFLGMRVAEEHGGAGVTDPRFGAIVGEEAMLAGVPALALVLTLHNDVAVPAIVTGSDGERLPGLASGQTLAAVGRLSGAADAGDRLTGVAPQVVAGAQADVFVLDAGDRVVLVAADADGVTVTPTEAPIGLDAAGLATVRCDGAAAETLPGSVDTLRTDLALTLATTALAGARAAHELTVAYVVERRAFGQPLSAFQNTRRMLGGLAAEIDVATAHLDGCLRRAVAGRLALPTALAAKRTCAGLFGATVDAGVQLHGGYGYIMEYAIAHAYVDARLWRLHEPEDEALLDAVADAVFGS